MARLESTAVAGYYPTPSSVIPSIANLLELSGEGSYAYVDPCAGEGSALLSLLEILHEDLTDTSSKRVHVHGIELEQTRHQICRANVQKSLKDWQTGEKILQGDAFRVSWEISKGAGLLWLNPPYDFDPICG